MWALLSLEQLCSHVRYWIIVQSSTRQYWHFSSLVHRRNSDPLRADNAVQKVCKEHNIAYMAYSSLGTQWQFQGGDSNPVLTHPKIQEIAKLRGCSVVQVVLGWALKKGQIVIPRSSNREHLRDNLHAAECGITAADFEAIDALDGTHNIKAAS